MVVKHLVVQGLGLSIGGGHLALDSKLEAGMKKEECQGMKLSLFVDIRGPISAGQQTLWRL